MTGTESDNLAVLRPDGTPVPGSPFGGFSRPMGITSSSRGELWIANSGLVDLPCPNKNVTFVPPPSLGYVNPATGERETYSGGGLLIPWGVSVDGHDNVWVSNFGGERLSEFCGRDNSPYCPEGKGKGDPISTDQGFVFDGLTRSTAAVADTAGNVWVTNNWQTGPRRDQPRRIPGRRLPRPRRTSPTARARHQAGANDDRSGSRTRRVHSQLHGLTRLIWIPDRPTQTVDVDAVTLRGGTDVTR